VLDLAVPRRIKGYVDTRAFYCGTPAPLYPSSEAGWVAEVNCTPGELVKVDRVVVADAAERTTPQVLKMDHDPTSI
jgi:hypothetical protein